MSMIDPIQNDGNSVLATRSTSAGSGSESNGTSSQTEGQAETTKSGGSDLPLVEIKTSSKRATKLSPTVQYGTDRYRLARPFTTRL
jgi:hypothetical protein